MAIVAEGDRGRIYLPPSREHELIAASAKVENAPETDFPKKALGFRIQAYGMTRHRDVFTPRQLVALANIMDLVAEARQQAMKDGGTQAYSNAIATYLALASSKAADNNSTICSWMSGIKYEVVRNTFARQALPMTWDYAESNPFAGSSGDIYEQISRAATVLETAVPGNPIASGVAEQLDATSLHAEMPGIFSTDPPYYDNIGYADLSDYFYIWLRRGLAAYYPDLFSTLLVPKERELVATPYRFDNDKERAHKFFEEGFGKAFVQMRNAQRSDFPLTVYYAFKQAEADDEDEPDTAGALFSTGWETMLDGLISSQLQVTGTWPIRSERSARSVAVGTNALASSVVLACRPRPDSAPITTRKDFIASLKRELPQALRNMQKGNIAPVDLAQAAIGPGMAVFSRYKRVLETDGSPMRVRTALALINQGLDEVLTELESEFDPDTRWALAWFEQHQFDEGAYGEAEVLATAKALSISHLAVAGMLHSRAGKVRLLRREELPEDWDPSAVGRLTVWEVTQHLIRSLDQKGEKETANLKSKIGGMAEIARDLAYRLYTLCERKGWAEEAGYYNSLVVAWPSMASEAFELR
jgi:putative DNA methylase